MPFRSRVFNRYLMSYLTVVLFICILLGLTLIMAATAQLRQAELEISQVRLMQTGDYFEQQFSAIEDIRLDIKTRLSFQPFYLFREKINELNLLDSFARYRNFSKWIEEYYLWYRDEAKVFSSRSTYAENVFFQEMMNGTSPEELTALLPKPNEINFQVLDTRPEVLVISMPFYFGTARISSGDCVLFIMVKLNQLNQTLWQMTGTKDDSPFEICYDGQCIQTGVQENKTISSYSTLGKVRLSINESSIIGLGRLASFEKLVLIILAATILIGIVVAFYAAWRSYKPIRKLFVKYEPDHKPSNELQTLEDLLSTSLKRNVFSQKQIEAQFSQLSLQQSRLKQQLVMMLMSGNDSPVVKQQIHEMGFEMPHGHYAVCFIYLTSDAGDVSGLMRSIEDFSDDECTLYAAELQEGREYIVLMNFQDEEQLKGILELMSDGLESRNLSVKVQLSQTCSQLNEIANVAIKALNISPVTLSVDSIEPSNGDDFVLLTELVENRSTTQALALLETMITQIENRHPSYLMRIYMLNRLENQIMALAYQEGVIVSSKAVNHDIDSVRQTMQTLVRSMCARVPRESDSKNQECGKAIAYMREHCLDNSISLSSTAEALGISTKQVSRLLRAEVDMTFKEYLLQLRMSAAQQLLRVEGLSITETANRVGYFNISHFIKCFKSYSGMTPGEWKKLANQTQSFTEKT